MLRTLSVVFCGLALLAGCSSGSSADVGVTNRVVGADAGLSGMGSADTESADTESSAITDGTPGETAGDLSGNEATRLADAGIGADDPALIDLIDPLSLPGDGFVSVGHQGDGSFEVLCGSAPCACSDGKDNDGDGVADGFDDECTGPFDNDEFTFATGIPGDNKDPKWQDCFFDGNSGAGDDGCRYHTDCITGKIDPATDEKKCGITEECVNFCQPLTPPGCDCFGCCGVTVEGETVNILVGESCSTENIADENACPRCTPTPSCQNECGECEICVGKGIEDLPAKCFTTTPPGEPTTPPGEPGEPTTPPPPPNVCDMGIPACTSSAECGASGYCSLGCCRLSAAR